MHTGDSAVSWHLLTGEYPPAPGGVSDYTRLVARALAAAGDAVEVWAPGCPGETPHDSGVRVNRLPSHFGPAALAELEHGLRMRPGPRRLLVQYVPHAFGFKAMNVGLAHWLSQVARRERLWIMFHEMSFPLAWGQPLKHNFLATVQGWMARQVARAARRRFVATPRWQTILHSYGKLAGTTEWLPVPSNVATDADPEASQRIRDELLAADGQILGHFGTFGDMITPRLSPPLLAALRRDPSRVALLIGRGAKIYSARLCRENPDISGRVIAVGELEAGPLANHLAACDLLLQPYPDGASARRGSLMAGAALGLPIVSSRGQYTESIWADCAALCLVEDTREAWADAVERLLVDARARQEMGRNARRLYRDRFAVERTVEVLRARYREDVEMEKAR